MDDIEGFLVTSYEDQCDEEIQTRKTRNEFIQEISCRNILHWNYRGLKEIPVELLGIVHQVFILLHVRFLIIERSWGPCGRIVLERKPD